MARYIDADALLSRLPDDLPYKASVKRVLIQASPADVAPKSEVKKYELIHKYIKNTILNDCDYSTADAYNRAFNKELDKLTDIVAAKTEVERLTIELDAMRGAANSYKMHYENLAKEIFAEIEKLHLHVTNEFDMRRYEELKKKYTD